jgi:4-hydroxymandelate oxidase
VRRRIRLCRIASNTAHLREDLMPVADPRASRCRVLKFLAGSPLLAWPGAGTLADATPSRLPDPMVWAPRDLGEPIKSPKDAIKVLDFVSNYGGRREDSGGATIDALPEVVQAIGGRIPVLVDSGFRRGTDVLKALALGAAGVCTGRPYLRGLGAFGQAGVERVLELMRAEFEIAMRQCGVRSVKELLPAFVRKA